MFSLKSWLKTQRPPDDDEQISAYIDGALDSAARQAFEARMASEPDLRRQVEATRLLVQAAAQLPAATVPRNFTLPASMGKPRPSPALSMWLRIGSAVAAAIFVFAVGLDISGILAPRMAVPVAAPQMAKSFAVQATSAPAATSIPDTTGAASSEMAANAVAAAASPTQAGEPTPEGTPAPLMMSMGAVTDTTQAHGGGAGAEMTVTPPAMSAKELMTGTLEASAADTYVVTQTQQTQRSAAVAEPGITPEAPVALAPPPAEQPTPAPSETPWLRIVAGLALVVAIGAGIAGWSRR